MITFVDWLESKGAKDKFMKHAKGAIAGKYFMSVPPYAWIGYPFTWIHTSEGVAYWETLYDEWGAIVKSTSGPIEFQRPIRKINPKDLPYA